MKNRLYKIMFFCAIIFIAQTSKAQGVRYHDMIFDSVSVTTVTYSDTFSLLMDIYQPVGDSVCNRPVSFWRMAVVLFQAIEPMMVLLLPGV